MSMRIWCGRTLWVTLAAVCLAESASAQEWTRFRGPNGSGVSAARGIPTAWTEQNIRWQADLPGRGISSPVLWGDKLFVTSAEASRLERFILCYSASDGKLLWSKAFPFAKDKKHQRNSYASATLAADAERVYAVWAARENSQLLALDHQGGLAWNVDLGEYGSGHGGGTSPVVLGDLVVLNNAQEREGGSFLLAVDRNTGRTQWRVDRASSRASYSTPCLFQNAQGREEIIFTSWAQGITSVDPATGKVNWERDVFERDSEKRAIGSPVVAGELVIGTAGFAGGKKLCVAIRPAGAAQGAPQEVYRLDRGVAHMPSVLVYEKWLFSWADNGVVSCFELASGELIWQQRLGGNYCGSPVCIAGQLYALSDEGECVVVRAAGQFEELARNKLPEGSRSTPAVAGGKLFVRTFSKLQAIGPAQ